MVQIDHRYTLCVYRKNRERLQKNCPHSFINNKTNNPNFYMPSENTKIMPVSNLNNSSKLMSYQLDLNKSIIMEV